MNIILKIKNKLFNAMQKSKKTENLTVEEKKEFIRNTYFNCLFRFL